MLESGGQSSWAARVLGEMGHEVVVVNPRRIRLIAESTLKTDRIDAEILARLGRQEEDGQLRPVYQRSEGAQGCAPGCGSAPLWSQKVPAVWRRVPYDKREFCMSSTSSESRGGSSS